MIDTKLRKIEALDDDWQKPPLTSGDVGDRVVQVADRPVTGLFGKLVRAGKATSAGILPTGRWAESR